tara:strand:+ start:192 stop:689 length:498 start_codon:yes stop_codon:yes gene_type:complete
LERKRRALETKIFRNTDSSNLSGIRGGERAKRASLFRRRAFSLGVYGFGLGFRFFDKNSFGVLLEYFGPSLLISLRKKMRLAEPATVFKSGRLKPPHVEVTVDPVIRPFLSFCRFHGYKWQKSTTELTHSILLAHFTRFARASLKMRLASLVLHKKCVSRSPPAP